MRNVLISRMILYIILARPVHDHNEFKRKNTIVNPVMWFIFNLQRKQIDNLISYEKKATQ